jgi:NAD(P)-dependent dehydrogenase (short-subunit alcohol dehydrogenase family)
MPIAVITGGSRGLGLALARELAAHHWNVIVDARDEDALNEAVTGLAHHSHVLALSGDVADEAHRKELEHAVRRHGGLDLLVNNASVLGPSPLPPLSGHPITLLEHVFRVNVIAPVALIQSLLSPLRTTGGAIINVTSDAATEPYEGWGGYGSSKAALEQATRVVALEHPDLAVYAFDPGDMRTAMHQAAYPTEDISDRPEPETIVPAVLRLISERPPSGRYRASDLAAEKIGT